MNNPTPLKQGNRGENTLSSLGSNKPSYLSIIIILITIIPTPANNPIRKDVLYLVFLNYLYFNSEFKP